MKNLILRIITAWAALRAGKVFDADNISVIASCREDADIFFDVLRFIKSHQQNDEYYNLITENIRIVLVSRNHKLPPFCLWHKTKQLQLRTDFFAEKSLNERSDLLVKYAVALRDNKKTDFIFCKNKR
ncbi:MAG: hypothetical protein IKA22_02760 [Lentisphaeria bacterium]|nr:hypothetical protein [Lentisphaeria bacterium]